MHPTLLKIGSFRIFSYGVFLALAFWCALIIAQKTAERRGLNQSIINDLFFYLLISAIIGSRLFYVATAFEDYVQNPLEIFKIWEGGLVFYGGFIAAALTAIFYLKKNKTPLLLTGDIVAPALSFGQFLGRMGCFFAGCCYGKACNLPWAVTFRNPESLATLHTPLHPTQLYSAFCNLIIFGILLHWDRKKKFNGHIFFLYIFLYGISRSFLEVFRDDFRGTEIFGSLSLSQAIGLTLAGFSLIMILTRNPNSKLSIGK